MTKPLADAYDWVVVGDSLGGLWSAAMAARLGLSTLVVPSGAARPVVFSEAGQALDLESRFVAGLGRGGDVSGLWRQLLTEIGLTDSEWAQLESGSPTLGLLGPAMRLEVDCSLESLQRAVRREFGPEGEGELPSNLAELAWQVHPDWHRALAALPRALTLSTAELERARARGRVTRPWVGAFEAIRARLWTNARAWLPAYASDQHLRAIERTLKIARTKQLERLRERGRLRSHWRLSTSAGKPDAERVAQIMGWLAAGGVAQRSTAPGVEHAGEPHWRDDPALVSGDPTLETLRALLLAQSGASVRGGRSALRETLLAMARRLGATVIADLECRRLFVTDGVLTGLQVGPRGAAGASGVATDPAATSVESDAPVAAAAGSTTREHAAGSTTREHAAGSTTREHAASATTRGQMIRARSCLLACSGARAQQLFFASGRHRRRMSVPRGRPLRWRFTVAVAIRENGVLLDVPPRVIWSEPGAATLECELARASDYDWARGGIQSADERSGWVLFLRTWLRWAPETLAREFRARLSARMLRQAAVIYPDLEFQVVRIYPDYRASGASDDAGPYEFGSLEEIPEQLIEYADPGVGSQTRVRRLAVANAESYPRWGDLGSARAALEALAQAVHEQGLPGPTVQ